MRKITLGHLDISETGKRYVQQVLDNNRLSRGPFTAQFEGKFAGLHGCDYGVFCNSGTSALQIGLAALKEDGRWEDGDEVLVPATTFIASSNVVLQNNLKPVFVEVDPRTFNMDPADIAHRITNRTQAIMPVHLFGLPADMRDIMQIARRWNLRVIEDSCETMFASIGKDSVGSFGDIACFSTYVAHLIVGGVGGIVTTNSSRLSELCMSYMQHGRDSIYTSIDDDDKPELRRQMIERRYSFERVGYSYRATELEAAIALSELERWESNIYKRRANAHEFTKLLSDIPQLQLPYIPDGYQHSFMMFPMVVDFHRDDLLNYLEERGIETRYMFPLLSQPIYRKLFPMLEYQYPVSMKLSSQGFFIGMHQGLTYDDIWYISGVMHEYFGGKR